MPAAFATFDEAHAWLIRGMVEYGWPDVSTLGGHIPPGVPGGLNLARLPEDNGQSGLVLEVPAQAGGRRLPEDGVYQFVVKLVSDGGPRRFVVRCPEANFLQEFEHDPAQPDWTAGYIHQAITDYVPQFVQWRMQGGEVSWAQRSGMPDFPGDPCSVALSCFVQDRLRRNQRFDLGPAQGWWMQNVPPPPPGPSPKGGFHAGMVTTGKGAGPTFLSADARAAVASAGAEDLGSAQALAKVSGPGYALSAMAGLGMFQGFLWFLNAITTVALFGGDRVGATLFSVVLGMGLLAVGAGAFFGANQYRKARGGLAVYLSMAYAALTPFCCLGGLPVAIWAALVWRDPLVASSRG